MEQCEADVQEEKIQILVEMGFTREKAQEAFLKTGNHSVELAASYLLSSDILNEESHNDSDGDWEDVEQNYKMVFAVNADLGMSIGKTAAQVAHGCLGLYREIEHGSCQESKDGLACWIEDGQKKIVLSGKNADKLSDLYSKAKSLGIPCHLVKDAGHTEIAPGSITVFACFGLEENVNKITGSLRFVAVWWEYRPYGIACILVIRLQTMLRNNNPDQMFFAH